MGTEEMKQVEARGAIEDLRRILEAHEHRVFTYDEALEVGESLLCYFKTLADEDDVTVLGVQEG